MKKLLLGAVLLVLVGCGSQTRTVTHHHTATATVAPTQTEPAQTLSPARLRRIKSGGITRSYLVYKPPGLRPGAPLVVALHPGAGSGAEMEQLTGFDQVAHANGFEMAYPNGYLVPRTRNDLIWHLGCCDAANKAPIDVNFISALISSLIATDHLDKTRVYVVGFSAGAAMAYRLVCELPSTIAAIGSVGGFEYLSRPCQPRQPVSVYEMHSNWDYWTGSCPGEANTPAAKCPHAFGQEGYEASVERTNAEWRQFDGCTGNPVVTKAANPSPANPYHLRIIQKVWNACRNGTSVRLDNLQHARHCWPVVGSTTCASYPATQLFWNFFAPHRLSP